MHGLFCLGPQSCFLSLLLSFHVRYGVWIALGSIFQLCHLAFQSLTKMGLFDLAECKILNVHDWAIHKELTIVWLILLYPSLFCPHDTSNCLRIISNHINRACVLNHHFSKDVLKLLFDLFRVKVLFHLSAYFFITIKGGLFKTWWSNERSTILYLFDIVIFHIIDSI